MIKSGLVNLQKKNPDMELQFKGAYDYFLGNEVYSQEEFQVYRNGKDQSILYQSEIFTRLESGEFMKAETMYTVTKDYVPIKVSVDRIIGNSHTNEMFSSDYSRTTLNYRYIFNEQEEKSSISVPPKFMVATSHTCCSFTFLGQKKYDPTGRNFHNILLSENLLEYSGPPEMSYILLVREDLENTEFEINKKKVKGTTYHIFSHEDHEKINEKPMLFVISKHFFIPYLVIVDEKIKIQIRYLNEIEKTKNEDIY